MLCLVAVCHIVGSAQDDAATLLEAGRKAFKNKEYNSAEGYFTAVIQLDPKNDTAVYNRGFSYLLVQKWDKALSDFTTFVERNPANAEGYVMRAKVLFELKKPDQGIIDLNTALELHPSTDWFVMRGYAHLQTNNFLLAERDFKVAIARTPESLEAWRGYGDAYFQRGEYISAASHYEKVEKIDPSNLLAKYQLGMVSAKLGNYQKALDYLTDEVIAENTSEGYAARGYCLFKLGNYFEAHKNASLAKDANISNPNAYHVLGLIASANGEYEAASALFDETIAIAPNHAQGLYNAGVNKYLMLQFIEAEVFLTKAMEYEEMKGAACMAMANLKLSIGESASACTFFKQASELGYEAHPEENTSVFCKE
jgi:tetratricopeptide (TPR) repeat protein